MRRLFVVMVMLLCGLGVSVQGVGAQGVPAARPELVQALTGDWTGVLEYRDYAEPAGSTKRVKLPTWLSISASGDGLQWHYIYDDGPGKTVEELDAVAIDVAAATYTESANGKPAQRFSVSGLDKLVSGRGQLVLSGVGRDNDKPSEVRVTMQVRRNLLEIVEEVRAAGTTGPYEFRHQYVFTRAAVRAVSGARN